MISTKSWAGAEGAPRRSPEGSARGTRTLPDMCQIITEADEALSGTSYAFASSDMSESVACP